MTLEKLAETNPILPVAADPIPATPPALEIVSIPPRTNTVINSSFTVTPVDKAIWVYVAKEDKF